MSVYSGSKEEEECKGRAGAQMVVAEKGRLLWGLLGEVETSCGWLQRTAR